MKNLWILILVLLVSGCTNQGNTERRYEDIAPIRVTNAGDGSWTIVSVTSDLTGASEQDQEMGDAATSPVFTAAWEAAQAMGAKDGLAFMQDIAPVLEKWIETINDSGNTTTTENTEVIDDSPSPTPSPPSEPGTVPNGDGESPSDPTNPNVIAVAACDETMSYRECDTCESVPQNKCLFRQWSDCNQVPVNSFTLVFRNEAGDTRDLYVPDKCSIAMGNIEQGFIKWRYIDDKKPHPVGYAPRGFDAVEAQIISND